MRPELSPGQLAPVRRFEPPLERIPADGLYVFRSKHEMYIKRLSKAERENGYYLNMLSDNDAYPTRRITIAEGTDFAVLGQVLT